MALTRIWNISDDPNTSAHPVTVTVLGKALAPGRSLQVEESGLKNAHKLHADVARRILHIGKKPPADYLKRVKPPRARLADGVMRTHGKVVPQEVDKAVDVVDQTKVEDKVEVETKPALEAPSEEAKPEESSEEKAEEEKTEEGSGYSSRRRRKGR